MSGSRTMSPHLPESCLQLTVATDEYLAATSELRTVIFGYCHDFFMICVTIELMISRFRVSCML